MLYLLVALILFALAVCAAVSVLPIKVVVALTAATAGSPILPARADRAVGSRSAGDTARIGRDEGSSCACGGPVPTVGPAESVPDLRAGGIVLGPGVDSLTVTRRP